MRSLLVRFALALALLLLSPACGNDRASPSDAGPDPTAEPVYYGEVQNIFNAKCVECHSADPDRLAPFSLATLDDALAAAETYDGLIAFSVMNRIMPPYYADQDGECNTYTNAHWLTADEIDAIVGWVNGARLPGDPANTDPTPPRDLPTIDDPEHTVATTSFAPTGIDGPDEFRCFVVDGLAQDAFVTGVHIRPSNLGVAHHAILFTLDTPEAEQDVLAKQAAAGGPFRCDGGPTNGATFLAGWAPGTQATLFPAGTGIFVEGGRRMVVQMHYNVAHGSGADVTTIDLALAPTVAKPARIARLSAPIDLPRGLPEVEASGTTTLPANLGTIELWGGGVHMHQRGIGATLDLPGDRCLMDLVNWSFHWQHFYWYAQPVELKGGDAIRLTCRFDTTIDNTGGGNIQFCEGTECEMCLEYVYVTSK